MTKTTMSRIVRFGLFLTAGVAVVGALVGYLTVGIEGLTSGLLAAALSLVFVGISALAVKVGEPLSARRDSIAPVLISVLVGWAVKFLVFLATVALLREAPFLDALAFYGMSFVVLLGSLAVDAIVLAPVVIAATWTKPGEKAGEQ